MKAPDKAAPVPGPVASSVSRNRRLGCWQCGKEVVLSKAWANKLKTGEITGEYCTKACAEADAWGPKFIDSSPVRMSTNMKADEAEQAT